MVLKYSLNRYVITAGLIGMAGSAVGMGMLIRAQYRVMKKPYCLKALEYLENNQTAMDLIGKPIEIKRPDLTDKNQIFGTLITDINVPFQGSKKSGMLHIVADRMKADDEQDWSVKRLDLKFEDMPNKMLIVYRRTDAEKSQLAL